MSFIKNNYLSVHTVLTVCASEALRTGALSRRSVWDPCADPSILTEGHLTWICDSARRVDRN